MTPDKAAQITHIHAGLIHQVVRASQNRDLLGKLEPILKKSADNGWQQLVAAIRKILAGQRDTALWQALDDEDQVIIKAILAGIRNPASLPDLNQPTNPTMAAPSFAQLIHATAHGDLQALQLLGAMAEQMSAMGGDMRILAGALRPLVDGERDADKLTRGLSPPGETLMLDIIAELNRLQPH